LTPSPPAFLDSTQYPLAPENEVLRELAAKLRGEEEPKRSRR